MINNILYRSIYELMLNGYKKVSSFILTAAAGVEPDTFISI